MPTINATILRAWRHAGETGRIHYAVERADSSQPRHLYADEGDTLYDVLEAHLALQGYEGPSGS